MCAGMRNIQNIDEDKKWDNIPYEDYIKGYFREETEQRKSDSNDDSIMI